MSASLLGHEWAAGLLKQHLLTGEVRHAYLFTGAPGIGRRSLALDFAAALNCTSPSAPGEACGECRVCRQIAKGQHPDLSIVEPESEGGMLKVDQIRQLQRSLSLTPYEAKYRVALIANFQFANANAQNALLKTLEEAPRQVILLLTADSPDHLLPTISSRCEILRLRPVSIDILEDALQKRWHQSPEKARLISHLANGRTGLALRMVEDGGLIEKQSAWVDEFMQMFTLNLRDRFAASERLAKGRDALRLMLQAWMSAARDLLLASNAMPLQLTHQAQQDEIERLAQALTGEQVLHLIEAIDRSLELLEVNANLRLLLDNLLLEIPHAN